MALLGVTLVSATVSAQTRADQERQREAWQRVEAIVRAMNVRFGATVADIGAGDGFFTVRLAAAVGGTGQVIAVDIDDRQLDRLRGRLAADRVGNVEIVKGDPADPKLRPGSLDAALIVNAYHEMTSYDAILTAIRAALKPEGRLVIVEPISAARRDRARAEQTRHHEIASHFVVQDARAAGFRIVALEDPFTDRHGTPEWMIVLAPSAGAVQTERSGEVAAPPRLDWQDPALRITLEDLLKLRADEAVTIVDVRDTGMFEKERIPGAVSVPLGDLESSAARLESLKQPFVTYCS